MPARHAFLVCSLALLTAACGQHDESSDPVPAARVASSDDLKTVRAVLAELLQRNPDDIRPEHTLLQLKADELDFIEAIMEIEDRLDIVIPDEAFDRVTGITSPERILPDLTVREFASVVTSVRRDSAKGKASGTGVP